MKALKYIAGACLVLTSFVSCTTSEVVSPENNVVPIQSIAQDGDTLLVINADSEQELVSSIVGDTVSKKAKKISVELTPKDDTYPMKDYNINAVVEGYFPSLTTKIALSAVSKGDMEREDGYPYYVINDSQVGVLKRNMIGYSTSSYSLLAKAIKDKNVGIDNETVLKLYASDIGFYALKPQTIFDLGLGLTQPMVQHMDSILILIDTDDGNVLSATFDTDSENSAKTLSKLVKLGYISQVKKAGESIDYSVLKLMFTEDKDIVNISKMPISEKQMASLKASIKK